MSGEDAVEEDPRDTCRHDRVSRTDVVGTGVWVCDACQEQFEPESSIAALVASELDTIAATMSAILWDQTTRMAEFLGDSSNTEQSETVGPQPPSLFLGREDK